MKSSLQLAVIKGIKVKVHWTFLLLIGWIVFLELSRGNDVNAILWSTAFILVLFVCVILHELGHALTARRFNIQTRQITLLPIGGVASLESMPEDPIEEFLVAIAGPAVNVVIAAVLYFFIPLESILSQDPESLEKAMSSINAGNFMFFLFSANVMLVLFNLLPAFPMDGGRILRALLSIKLNRVRATQIAAVLGQMVAFLFFFIGLLYNPILILIAIFVYFGAQGENLMIQQLSLLRGYSVRDAMMTDISLLHPEDTLNDVIDLILSGTERDFLVAENDEILGIIHESTLKNSISNRDRNTPVQEIMDPEVYKVNADDKLTDIYSKVRTSSGNAYFPVMDEGKLAGAIDLGNINEFIVFRASLDY